MYAFGFGSIFHQFCKSNIDELLNRENLLIEDILDDDNILTDARGNNEKFGKYLYRHPDFIKSLIDYIIKEPEESESDFRVCYKYPFVSSEILGSEISELVRGFFEDARESDSFMSASASRNLDQMSDHEESKERKESIGKEETVKAEKEESKINKFELAGIDLLEYLMTFLEKEEKFLNPTLAGYFQKAINAILNKRGFDFLNFLFERKDYLKKLIYHSVNKSISEIILRILMLDIPLNDNKTIIFINERAELIKSLFIFLEKSDSYEEIENIAGLLSDIINRNANVNGGADIVLMFIHHNNLSILYNKLNSKNLIISSSCCSLLIALMNYLMHKRPSITDSNSSPLKDFSKQTPEQPKENVIVTDIDFSTNVFFKLLNEKLEFLVSIINEKPLGSSFQSTYGGIIQPFGVNKIKILELINLSMKIKCPLTLIETLKKLNIFELLINLSIKYEFNSFLHNLTEKIFYSAFESDSHSLLISLVSEIQLPQLLIKGIRSEDLTLAKSDRRIRRGFIGHFIKIANFLIATAIKNEYLKEPLKNDVEWVSFVEKDLDAINIVQNKDLGGYNPKKNGQGIGQNQEEEDNSKIEIDIKKIYEKFSQFFQSGPPKPKQDDQENEVEEDYEKESPEYGSPEKNQNDNNDLDIKELELQDNSFDDTKKEEIGMEEYYSNNFWKKPDIVDLNQIMQEME